MPRYVQQERPRKKKKNQETVHFSNFDSHGTQENTLWPVATHRKPIPLAVFKKKKKKFVAVSNRSSRNCYTFMGIQEKSARAVNEQQTKLQTGPVSLT